MQNKRHNILSTLIMLLTSGTATVAVIYLIFRNIHLQTLLGDLRDADRKFFILALMISAIWNIGLYALIREKIWQYMGYVVSYQECLLIRAGSLPLQAIPSFKDTGLAMALYLKNRFRMPLSEGILSNIVVNFFSLTGVLFLLLLGYIFYRPGYSDLVSLNQHLMIKLLPVILFIGCVVYAFYFNQALGKRVLFYACFKKRSPLFQIFEKNINLWKGLPRRKIFGFFMLATIYKLAEVIIFYSLARAYHLRIPAASLLLFVPLAMMISESPLNIAGIGVREGALVFFFYNLAPKETLVSVALLILILNRVFPIMLGLFFLAPFLSRTQLSSAKIKEWLRPGSTHVQSLIS